MMRLASRDGMQSQRLQGLVEPDLLAVERDAGPGEGIRDVTAVDRAIERAGLARLAQDDDAPTIDLDGHLLATGSELGGYPLSAHGE